MSNKIVKLKNSSGDILTPNSKGGQMADNHNIQSGAVTGEKLCYSDVFPTHNSTYLGDTYTKIDLDNGVRVITGTTETTTFLANDATKYTISLAPGDRFITSPVIVAGFNHEGTSILAGICSVASNNNLGGGGGLYLMLKLFNSTTVNRTTKIDYVAIGRARPLNVLNIEDFTIGSLSSGQAVPSITYRINNAAHHIPVKPGQILSMAAYYGPSVKGMRVGVHSFDSNGNFVEDSGWKQIDNEDGMVHNMYFVPSNVYSIALVFSLSTTSSEVTTGGTENTTPCSTVDEFLRGSVVMVQ